jgi:hypothetical protein
VRAADAAAQRRNERGHGARALARSISLFLSVAVPIAFVAYANHVRKSTGINWLTALGALVAVSLVIAMAVFSTRSEADGRSRPAKDAVDDVPGDRE